MVGIGLQGSLTGSGRLEVILFGVIVVAAVVLLLARLLRSTDRKRRKGASVYFDKNAANKGATGRDPSTGTAAYPSTGAPVAQPMAPSFAAPRRGGSPQDRGPTPGRPPGSTGAPGTSAGPRSGGTPVHRMPVGSPVLDPLPPLRTEGIDMPKDKRGPADPPVGPTPDPGRPSSTPPTPSPSSSRTAVPANLPPLAPPPSAVAESQESAGPDAAPESDDDSSGDT